MTNETQKSVDSVQRLAKETVFYAPFVKHYRGYAEATFTNAATGFHDNGAEKGMGGDKQPATSALQACAAIMAITSLNVAFGEEKISPDPTTSIPPNIGATLMTPAFLEAQGARIGSISIINENIFNSDDPAENRSLHRWANALHITTKPDVIRTQLLFQSGDRYSKQQIHETERLLRSNRFLREATVRPVGFEGGVVDLEVRTTDVWTLGPSVSFGRGGGKNSGGVGLKEYNLLGTGTSIGIGYKSDVDRDTLSFRYFDRNLLSSRYQILAEYADASDGFAQRLILDKPFFALDSRRAGGAMVRSGRRTESLYDAGDIAAQFEHAFEEHEVYIGRSKGLRDDWSKRIVTGIGYNSHEYFAIPGSLYPQPEIPGNRKFLYPFVGIEILQDEYVSTRNFDQMNRTEDRHLGLRASFRLGYAGQAFGSSTNAWIYNADMSNTLYRSRKSTLVMEVGLHGRIEDGTSRNAEASVSARFDRRQSENRLLHISMTATAGENLDFENTKYLGGDSGLRGYPLRYQAGDSSVLFTIEQRLFTDWYPFRLFNIGGAVFFDAGRTWGRDPVHGKNYGWLRDIGVGLRIGSTRSGIGRMIHVDLAYPLDGGSDIKKVQLLVEARKGF